jgi:Laminin G domain
VRTHLPSRPRRTIASRGTTRARVAAVVTWMTASSVLAVVLTVASAAPASAAATVTLADWQMNEPPGATVMTDNSGNGIEGSIGSGAQTGFLVNGSTAYHWTLTPPNQPPAQPERLILVDSSQLNPGTRDYAVTIRFRTTHSVGNMIQKGQAGSPGGYFKWEIPNGRLRCQFTSKDGRGNVIANRSAKAPLNMPLNDGEWHTVRCEKTDRVTMTIDGTTVVQSSRATWGPISNDVPLTIAGKSNCDQITITCDYFAGEIDWIKIEASTTGSTDHQPPNTPGQPTGTSTGFTTTDLSWQASTDDVSTTLQYRIFRDGAHVATIASSDPVVTFTDTGLVPGSTHTYSIVAVDLAGNQSQPGPASDSITVLPAPSGVFVDDFSSGFSQWTTVSGMSIDDSTGNPYAPSARVQATSQGVTLTKILPTTLGSACASFDINVTTLTSNVILMRLLTGTGGGIVRVIENPDGTLSLRSDATGTLMNSGVPLGAGWHDIELCGTVGLSGTWDLYLDGAQIVNGWVANTGTSPIGRVLLGDYQVKTWTANYDFVVVDQAPGEA